MNQCHFLGNLTRDPELKQVNGKNVVNFAIAVNSRFSKKDNNKALFLNCEAWDNGADLINQYFTKGKPIIVHGELRTDNWTDNEGQKRTATRLRVNQFEFVPNNNREDGKEDSKQPEAVENTTDNTPKTNDGAEIPF